jgi:hypothetical protein
LGLPVASRYYELFIEKFLFLKSFFYFWKEMFYFKKKVQFLEKNSGYRRAADTLNESPEGFKKSRNKRFVHN